MITKRGVFLLLLDVTQFLFFFFFFSTKLLLLRIYLESYRIRTALWIRRLNNCARDHHRADGIVN